MDGLIDLLDEKKGEDIKVIDVSEITSITKFMVIVTTMTNVHSNSLAKYVVEYFEAKAPDMLLTKNPAYNNPWVLVDGADIIVHILLPEARSFYSLEKLYFKGKIVDKKLGVL